jgi:hypothetical protein
MVEHLPGYAGIPEDCLFGILDVEYLEVIA